MYRSAELFDVSDVFGVLGGALLTVSQCIVSSRPQQDWKKNCVFRGKADSDSEGRRTAIPTERGQ